MKTFFLLLTLVFFGASGALAQDKVKPMNESDCVGGDCNKKQADNPRTTNNTRRSRGNSASSASAQSKSVEVKIDASGIITVIEKGVASINAKADENTDEIIDAIDEASDTNHADLVNLTKVTAAGFNNQMTKAQADQIIALLLQANQISAEQAEYQRKMLDKMPSKTMQWLQTIFQGVTATATTVTAVNTGRIARNTGDTNNILAAIYQKVMGNDNDCGGRRCHDRDDRRRHVRRCYGRNCDNDDDRPRPCRGRNCGPIEDDDNRPCRVRNGPGGQRIIDCDGNRETGDNRIDPLRNRRTGGSDPWQGTGNVRINGVNRSFDSFSSSSSRGSDRVARRNELRAASYSSRDDNNYVSRRTTTSSSSGSGRRRAGN